MRCAQCYHDLHTGAACSCGCRSAPVGSPYNPWVVDAENVVVETESVTYCGHGNDPWHCHMCEVSKNFKALALAIFLLIVLYVAVLLVVSLFS